MPKGAATFAAPFFRPRRKQQARRSRVKPPCRGRGGGWFVQSHPQARSRHRRRSGLEWAPGQARGDGGAEGGDEGVDDGQGEAMSAEAGRVHLRAPGLCMGPRTFAWPTASPSLPSRMRGAPPPPRPFLLPHGVIPGLTRDPIHFAAGAAAVGSSGAIRRPEADVGVAPGSIGPRGKPGVTAVRGAAMRALTMGREKR
jgi:hypothetical protein